MLRTIAGAALALTVAIALMPGAHAQTSSPGGFQSAGSAGRYQLSVPSGWQQIPLEYNLSLSGVNVRVDQAWGSSEDKAFTIVEILAGSGATLADPAALLSGAVRGMQSSLESAGASSISVFTGPTRVDVANSDSAMTESATYSDPAGVSQVLTIVAAVRSATAYFLVLGVPASYYSSNAAYGQILSSFQLLPGAG